MQKKTRFLLTLCCLAFPLAVGAAAAPSAAPLKDDQKALTGFYHRGNEIAAVRQDGDALHFYYQQNDSMKVDTWNRFGMWKLRGNTYEMNESGPASRASSTVRFERHASGIASALTIGQKQYLRYVPVDGAGNPLSLASAEEAADEPDEMPLDEEALVGFYHGGGAVLAVRENEGQLQLLYKTSNDDKDFSQSNFISLTKNRYDQYELHEAGPYTGAVSEVRFSRDKDGNGISMVIGSRAYTRTFTRGENGKPTRFKPSAPMETLRQEAAKVPVPVKPHDKTAHLVDITTVVPSVKLDLQYASDRNLFGTPLVTSPKALLDQNAANALAKVQQSLAPYGYGLVIWEGYRSYRDFVTAKLALGPSRASMLPTQQEGFSHNTGRSVDVSLCDLESGEVVRMISDFDEPSPAQFGHFAGGTSLQRWQRNLLRRVMEENGFKASDMEWWHFDFDAGSEYELLNE